MQENVTLNLQHQATGINITLRCMGESQIRHLIELAQDRSLIETMGWDTFFKVEETDAFIDAIAACSLPYSCQCPPLVFGIFVNTEALPIGYSVLKGMNMVLHTAEVGVAVLDKRYRPKGYGRLVLKLAVDYAFNDLDIETVGAAILASNKQSVNMCKRVGFVVKASKPWQMPDGQWVEMLLMEVSKCPTHFCADTKSRDTL